MLTHKKQRKEETHLQRIIKGGKDDDTAYLVSPVTLAMIPSLLLFLCAFCSQSTFCVAPFLNNLFLQLSLLQFLRTYWELENGWIVFSRYLLSLPCLISFSDLFNFTIPHLSSLLQLPCSRKMLASPKMACVIMSLYR